MKFNSSMGEIHYELYGEKDKPLLTLFHVMGGDRFFFKKQIDRLSENYSVLTWDLPWHGESVKPEGKLRFDVIEMCFIELLEHLNVDMAYLSGVSLGGLLVQYIAAKNPGKFYAIHVDGAPPIEYGYHFTLRFMVQSVLFFSQFVPKKVLSLSAANLLSTDSASKNMIKNHFNTFSKKHILNLFRGTTDEALSKSEKKVHCPMLFTHGENDFGFIRRRCLKYHEAANHTSYLVVHGGGHLHIKTNPQAYSEALIRFLKSL